MGAYIEFGVGYDTGANSYEAGRNAALLAYKSVKKYEPTLVLVFSSINYDNKEVLRGVREITANTPLVGGTAAGNFCHGFHSVGVTVAVIASPYLTVRLGIGRSVGRDFGNAVQEAIDSSGAGEYFGQHRPQEDRQQLDLDYAKKTFALVLMPGSHTNNYNYDVIDLLRKRSMNAFPLVGGCMGDWMSRQETFQFYNGEVITDSVLLAVFDTHLKFGVAASLDFTPSNLQASITKVDGYEIKEFYYEPAAEFYAKLLNINIDDLRKDPEGYFTTNPLGISDEFGNYSIIMGVEVTGDNGIKCLRKPYPNATVTIMGPDREKMEKSLGNVIEKAVLRSRISKPSAGIVFSSVYRLNFLGQEVMKRVAREIRSSLRRNHFDMEYTGFVSYGEAGTTDEGLSVYLDFAVSCLVFADELNEASVVAFKNKMLYEELSATAIRNQILYEELSAVHEMSNLLNSSLDLKFVINKAAEIVGKFFQADGCGLFIYDEQTDNFKLAGLYDDKPLPKSIEWKKTFPYYTLLEQKALMVNDTGESEYISPELNNITKAKSVIAAPIIVKGEKIGVVSAYSRQTYFFNNDDLEFLQTLSNQIGTAIVNARLFEQTQLLACTDGLTGLYDHNFFLKALSRMIKTAQTKQQRLSLVMVDLDDFKYCNDKYGHTVGDTILQETAEILKSNVRNDDVIARYGGDEFVIILVNAAKERAYQIAERIRRKISGASFQDPESGTTFGITASIGIATFPDDAATAKHLIDKADKAMYRVKRQVKNKSQLYFSSFAELEREFTASEKAFFDTIKVLLQILDSKDRYTWEHSRQVASYAVQLAEELGLPEEEKYWLRLTGYLHDIGKIHVSSEILNKKGRLNSEELSVIRLHPVVGANLLAPIKGFKKIVPIIYHHHEWFDGSGYPSGLSGHDIPKGARILTVVDGFDAMTSNRPYRKAQSIEWAINELQRNKGRQYDPEIVDVFVEMIRKDSTKAVKIGRRQADKK